ncbi:MAG: ATP-binding protein, partial [Flammeovirgaceae bacterium]|nr:ATP-binding protein [Flammeovirgaceae bacterium]
MINLYKNRNAIKRLILIVALMIGAASLFYTQSLVEQLSASEKRQIDFFAKAQKLMVSPTMNTAGSELHLLLMEIINANQTIPVILTDEHQNPIDYRNLEIPTAYSLDAEKEKAFLLEQVQEMKKDYPPIVIEYGEGWVQYIYYTNSPLVKQLNYYPYLQILTLTMLAILAYLTFDASRRAEENRLWAGLAKETAHQLGTPISSLMAWIEFFKSNTHRYDEAITLELEKDVARLQTITARFSNIGSIPVLQKTNLENVIAQSVAYLSGRISKKVIIQVHIEEGDYIVPLNTALFEWVIENLCKNAVDAMNGCGTITIRLQEHESRQKVYIDISDTGKGILKSEFKLIFQAGYTSKKRGWGLGLTLAKRI